LLPFAFFLWAGAAVAKTDAPDALAVAFGTMPALWNVQMSPDGSKLSFLQMHREDLPIMGVFDARTGKVQTALASVAGKFDIQWCDWANDERLLCGFRGVAGSGINPYPVTRLVAVNADGSGMKVLLQSKLRGEYTQFQDQIVDWLVDDPEHVLVQMPSSKGSGISRLDIYSGRTSREKRIRDAVRRWMSDGRGTPRLYLHQTEYSIRWRYRHAGESEWRLLHESKATDLDDYYPVGFGDDPNALLVIKPFESRLALWLEDLGDERTSRVVFSHPDVDVGGAIFIGRFRRMVAVGYSTDRSHLHFFDADVEQISDRISALFPGMSVNVVDESWDRSFYLVHVTGDRDPGAYYRFDVKKSQLVEISPQYPRLEDRPLSPMTPIHYEARDGTRIPAYLTLPTAAPQGALPAVILPHGGPESRDYWGFDWIAQFLAARGYAVLQSNFRGSGGYGSAWAGAGGFRDWRRAIGDLGDGAQHLIETGVADPGRLCVLGWSYGGYAALLSGIEEPERYRCAVSIAGVTDPRTLIRDYRNFLSGRGMREFVSTDAEVLVEGSPLKRAGEIRIPVLLFHGEKDINVSVDHSKRMAKALERAKKVVEFVEYEDVEHDIARNEFRVDMLSRIGAFLDRHTGPRRGE
jgi:dipeptidyl aminopeptidase/acylaminoacyl peptidase